jgi:DNA-binding beta-propeller fold protein YncE
MSHPIALALSAVLLAGCASGGAREATKPSPSPGPTGEHQRGVVAVIHTGHGPSGLLVAQGVLFVGAHRGGTVGRIDPATNRVTATLAVGGQLEIESSTSLGGLGAVDETTGSIWACTNTDGVLHQINPRTMKASATVAAQCDGGTRTRVGKTLWAVPGDDSKRLLIIDTETGRVLHQVSLGGMGFGWGAAVDTGSDVIVGTGDSTPVLTPDGRILRRSSTATPWLVSTGGRLYRIPRDGSLASLDPKTLAVTHTFRVPQHLEADGEPQLVADDKGHLFYRPDIKHVYRIDIATGTVKQILELPYAEANTAMAWAFGSLWVTNFDADTVWRVDPEA